MKSYFRGGYFTTRNIVFLQFWHLRISPIETWRQIIPSLDITHIFLYLVNPVYFLIFISLLLLLLLLAPFIFLFTSLREDTQNRKNITAVILFLLNIFYFHFLLTIVSLLFLSLAQILIIYWFEVAYFEGHCCIKRSI